MKSILLFTLLVVNTMSSFSKVMVEDAKAYKDFAFSAYTPVEAYDFFVNPKQHGFDDELIQLNDREINEIESLINNAALKLKFHGRDLSTAKGMTIFMSMIIKIDSTNHFFIVRDRSILTEILDDNYRIDYIFINEKQKMALGNLAMRYSVSKKYGYKNPIELPVNIDRITYYGNSWGVVNPGNVTYFFENPEKYVKNLDLIQIKKQDVMILESMLNNATKVKKHWNRIIDGSWERSKRKIMPIIIMADSLEHNFVLSPDNGKIIELVNGGEVIYYFKDKQNISFISYFVEKYSLN